MKTIAITIDAPTLKEINRLAARGRNGKRVSRSELVRTALHDFLRRNEEREREQREQAILAKNRTKLAKELEALVEEQARP